METAIVGLYINRPNEDNIGLFGVNQGAIEKLKVYVYDIKARNSIGGLVGKNLGSIENCSTHGKLYGSSSNNGGLVGSNQGIVKSSYSIANVTSYSYSGLLVGQNFEANASIQNSYSLGSILGYSTCIGGIVGDVEFDGEIQSCYSGANVKLIVKSVFNHHYAGGICGDIYYGTYNSIINSNIAMNKSVIIQNTDDHPTLPVRISRLTYALPNRNNYAYKDMILSDNGGKITYTVTSNDEKGLQGKDITLDDFKNPQFFLDNLSPAWDFTDVWEILPEATRPTLITNPDGLGINYPDGLTPEDRKNFKYYIVKDDNNNPKIILVSLNGKDASFERADIIDRDNKLKSGVYYIDDKGNIRKYDRYYNWD